MSDSARNRTAPVSSFVAPSYASGCWARRRQRYHSPRKLTMLLSESQWLFQREAPRFSFLERRRSLRRGDEKDRSEGGRSHVRSRFCRMVAADHRRIGLRSCTGALVHGQVTSMRHRSAGVDRPRTPRIDQGHDCDPGVTPKGKSEREPSEALRLSNEFGAGDQT
jgi:hypothetical protein